MIPPFFSDEYKKLLQIAIDSIPLAVRISSASTGEIIMINKLGIELLGNPFIKTDSLYPTAIFLKKDGTFYPQNELPASLALEANAEVIKDDIYINKADNSKNLYQITAAPVKNSQNQPEFIFEIFKDIMQVKEVDRTKTDFISLASHQLRTPLSALRWFSQMLLSGDAGELNNEQKEFVQNVSDSADRMVALVNSLLNVSRIESGRLIINPKPTNLRGLIEKIVEEQKIKADERKIKLAVSVDQTLPEINIDPKLIDEVYSNLLSNAIKYTSEGGEIKIIVSEAQTNIISQISDNGVGIPQENQSKIFQKFFRGDNAIKLAPDGNGLGLHLVKAIVETSGGEIWFNSAIGKGTSFYFSLPKEGSHAQEGDTTLS